MTPQARRSKLLLLVEVVLARSFTFGSADVARRISVPAMDQDTYATQEALKNMRL